MNKTDFKEENVTQTVTRISRTIQSRNSVIKTVWFQRSSPPNSVAPATAPLLCSTSFRERDDHLSVNFRLWPINNIDRLHQLTLEHTEAQQYITQCSKIIFNFLFSLSLSSGLDLYMIRKRMVFPQIS